MFIGLCSFFLRPSILSEGKSIASIRSGLPSYPSFLCSSIALFFNLQLTLLRSTRPHPASLLHLFRPSYIFSSLTAVPRPPPVKVRAGGSGLDHEGLILLAHGKSLQKQISKTLWDCKNQIYRQFKWCYCDGWWFVLLPFHHTLNGFYSVMTQCIAHTIFISLPFFSGWLYKSNIQHNLVEEGGLFFRETLEEAYDLALMTHAASFSCFIISFVGRGRVLHLSSNVNGAS